MEKKQIIIKDKDTNEMIVFGSFKKEMNAGSLLIGCSIAIHLNGFETKETTIIDLSDFAEMLDNLIAIRSRLIHTYYFQHGFGKVKMCFQKTSTSEMLINGTLKGKNNSWKLDFRINSDMAHISNLILQLEGLIDEYCVEQ